MRSRSAFYGWLSAEAVSLTGTRLSMIAVPWLVLTSTGSATRTGVVAFAEMAPYVVAKAASGPWVDRLGARRVCVATDLASMVVVGLIPVLHALDLLDFAWLLVLVAVAGTLRGPGDGARYAILPTVVAASGVSMERATGLGGAVERLASTVGAALAGVLVALMGPANALVLDALSFGVSACLLAATVPRPTPPKKAERSSYRSELAEGWRFLRGEPVLLTLTVMISVTNLLDIAYAAVLVPVWAEDSGRGASAIGLLFAVFSGAAVLGSVVAAAYADRLPRRPVYLVAFLIGGLPRFVVLALDLPLAVVLSVAVVGGFAVGFINPILGAVFFERIPERLTGRVTTLTGSIAWVGIPFGGMLAGVLVTAAGVAPALLIVGAAYLVATLTPVVLPGFRDFGKRPEATPAERAT